MGSQNEHEVTREEHVNKFEQEQKNNMFILQCLLKKPQIQAHGYVNSTFFFTVSG